VRAVGGIAVLVRGGADGVPLGAALHFRGKELARVVSSRPRSRAYRVEPIDDEVVETPLDVEYLGARIPELARA
jgi:dipeptidase E